MKVAITGHTRGLGAELWNRFDEKDTLIGFSKSTGHDISYPQTQNTIVCDAFDCDVFINNAYSGFAQTDLLVKLTDAWKHIPGKFIVNVGSLASYHDKRRMHPYSIHKIALDKQAEQIQANFPWPKIINFRPALFESDMGYSSEFNRWRKKIEVSTIADVIMYAINNRNTFLIKDIVIDTV